MDITRTNDHAQTNCSEYALKVRTLGHREFKGHMVWIKDEVGDDARSRIVVASETIVRASDGGEHASRTFEYKLRWLSIITHTVEAKRWTLMTFKQLEECGGVPQTEVTVTSQLDLGGLIPKGLTVGFLVGRLSYLSLLHKMFDKSTKIDAATRGSYLPIFQGRGTSEYTLDEDDVMTKKLKWFADFEK